jgi:hypothetical protein
MASPPSQPACPPNTVCPPDAVPAVAPGQTPAGFCVEASCTTDADCGATMVCHTDSIMACSGGSTCPPNAECLVPNMKPVCTTTNVSTCKYKWELSCKVDADCGDGFNCTFPTITGCSGSGMAGTGTVSSGTATPGSTGTGSTGAGSTGSSGTGKTAPAMDGGAAPGPTPVQPADNCTTTTSTVGFCAPKATSCTVDSDCPTAWTCVDAPPVRGGPVASADGGVGIAVGEPAPTGNASSIAPGEPAPSGNGADPAPTKMCLSPLGTLTGVALDTGSGAPKEAQSGGGNGGAGGGVTTGTNGGTPPTSPGATNGPSGNNGAGAPSSGGCALGGNAPGGSGLAAALALLGLVLSRRRR